MLKNNPISLQLAISVLVWSYKCTVYGKQMLYYTSRIDRIKKRFKIKRILKTSILAK